MPHSSNAPSGTPRAVLPMILGGTALLSCCVFAILLTNANAGSPQDPIGTEPYKVGDFRLGQQIRPALLQGYTCKPSDQFEGFAWCVRSSRKKEARGTFTLSESLLRSPGGNAVYINRSYSPAFFNANEVNSDIEQRMRQLGERPRILRRPAGDGLPEGVIAVWGKVALEPLDQKALNLLSRDQSPRVGFLIDYLNDPTLSANRGLPVYRLGGDGPGYVWAATFDNDGKGKLRFLAIEAPAFSRSENAVGSNSGPASNNLKNFENRPSTQKTVELLGIDQNYTQASGWTIGYHVGHTGCVMAASYGAYGSYPDISVWLGFHKDRNEDSNFYFGVTSPAWTVEPEKEHDFQLMLGQSKFTAHGFGVRWKDESGYVVINTGENFVQEFKFAERLLLSFTGGRTLAGALRLSGARDALARLQECQNQAPAIAANLVNKQRNAQDDAGRASERDDPKYGTGFFVSENGHVLTNNHVAEGCAAIVVHTSDGQNHVANVVKTDRSNDLALMKTGSKSLSVAEFETEGHLGERVFVFSYPLAGFLSSSGTFTDGSVSSLEGIRDDSRMLQVSAPIQPGNSGGPLLNEKGNVLDIVTSKADVLALLNVTQDIAQNVNFAIKSGIALAFLQSADVKPRVAVNVEDKKASEIAGLAKAMSVMVICHSSSETLVTRGSESEADNKLEKTVAIGPITPENAFTGLWVSNVQQCVDRNDNTPRVRFVAGGFQLLSWVCTQGSVSVQNDIATMQGRCSTRPGDNYDNPEVTQTVELRNEKWKLSVVGEKTTIAGGEVTNAEFIKCQ